MKINHNELLTYPNKYDQTLFGKVKAAWDMGAAAVGATIYFGSEESNRQLKEIAEAFEEAHSFISNKYYDYDVEDNVFAIMRDAKGVIASIQSSATQWQHSFQLGITMEEGFIELSGILSSTKSYGKEKLVIVPKQDKSVVGSLSAKTIQYLDDSSWNDEINEFADVIINNKPVKQGNSHDALKIMRLIDKIYKADKDWK